MNSVRFECACECQGKVALPTLTTCAERVGMNSVRFECECECRGKIALPTLTTCAERVGNAEKRGGDAVFFSAN